jgi:hypothetical protein
MILNSPCWAILDPTGKQVVWGHAAPYLEKSPKAARKTLNECRKLAQENDGGWCRHDAAWWKACTVQKIVVLRACAVRTTISKT